MRVQFLISNKSLQLISRWSLALVLCLGILAGPARAADVLRVNVFAGAGNLALFTGLTKGFFDRRDLKVEPQFTPNSD